MCDVTFFSFTLWIYWHKNSLFVTFIVGRAMDQAVRRQPLTAKTRVRSRVIQSGICGGQSGTETGFSQSSSVSPFLYHFRVALHTHISFGDEQYCRW
jgi:hypothetical protein